MKPATFLLLTSTAALGACAHVEEATADDDGALIGGDGADERYVAVGALTQNGAVFCTATLVARDRIVTAKHCIAGGSEDMPEDRDPATVFFRIGPDANAPLREVALRRWRPAPDFPAPDYVMVPSDVTLAELAAPLDGVPPIALAVGPLNDAEVSTSFDVVGFGVRAPDGRGAVGGKREVGTFALEAMSGNAFEKRYGSREKFDEAYARIDPDGAADDVGDRIWAYGQLHEGYEVLAHSKAAETCFSDSGGPMLRHANGSLEVVGVVSRGFPGYASSCLALGTVFGVFGPNTAAFLRTELAR